MQPRGPSRAVFVAFILLVGLLAGCGGGNQSQNGGQDKAAGGAKQGGGNGQGAGGQGQGAVETKIAIGTVVFINPDTERFTLRPTVAEQGEKPIPFKLVPKARLTLDGEEATFGDMEQGQQAQVEYIVRNDQDRARVVKLFSKEGSNG
jgi:hypothetical protein